MSLSAELIAPDGFDVLEGSNAEFILRVSGFVGSYSYSYSFDATGGSASTSDFSGGVGSGSSSFSSTSLFESDTPITLSTSADGDPNGPDVDLFLDIQLSGAQFPDGSSQQRFEINILNDPTPVISPIAGDNVISSVDKETGVEIEGQSLAEAAVEVSLAESMQTTQADEAGNWTVFFPSDEIPDDGDATVAVRATDSEGNDATNQMDVSIKTSVELSGTVIDRSGDALADTEVKYLPEAGDPPVDSVQADGAGSFSMSLPADTDASGRLDAVRDYSAGDPDITAQDALEVLRLAVGLEPSWGPAEAHDYIAADVNGDGQVTAQDALEVLRHAVGLETEHAREWVFVEADADLGEISRDNVAYDTGVEFAALEGDLDVSLAGILVGSMQEYA